MSMNNITIPVEFSGLRHTVKGGTSPMNGMNKNQEKVNFLLKNVKIDVRRKILKYYFRDFKLFEYKYNPLTNKIY